MRQKATYVGRFRSYDSRMCVVVLSKRALKDLSIYCTFYFFSFYLLVKLFTLPELIVLVNKDLQYFTDKTPHTKNWYIRGIFIATSFKDRNVGFRVQAF